MSAQPKFSVVSSEIPDAPYDKHTSAGSYGFDLDVQRMQNSDSWAVCPAEIRPWMMMSWVISWVQRPCGSLPGDDELIAAKLGCSPEFLQVHRKSILRGWVRHADGRLYHPVVTEEVLKMVQSRDKWRTKKQGQRESKQGVTGNVPGDTQGTLGGVPVESPLSPSPSPSLSPSQKQEEQPSPPAHEEKKPKARGARLQLDAAPKDWIDFCVENRPDLSPSDTWDRFRDYWIAQPGQKGVKTDWLATWRNWVRSEKQGSNRHDASRKSPSTAIHAAHSFDGRHYVGTPVEDIGWVPG